MKKKNIWTEIFPTEKCYVSKASARTFHYIKILNLPEVRKNTKNFLKFKKIARFVQRAIFLILQDFSKYFSHIKFGLCSGVTKH